MAKSETKTPRGWEQRHVNGYTFGRLWEQAKWPTGAPIQLPLEFCIFAKRLFCKNKTHYKSSDCSTEAICRSSWPIHYCLENSNRTHTHTHTHTQLIVQHHGGCPKWEKEGAVSCLVQPNTCRWFLGTVYLQKKAVCMVLWSNQTRHTIIYDVTSTTSTELLLQRLPKIVARREGNSFLHLVITTFLSWLTSFRWLREQTTSSLTPPAGDGRRQVVLEGDRGQTWNTHIVSYGP